MSLSDVRKTCAILASTSFLLLLALSPRLALSECIPLPTVDLRAIDRYTDIDPDRAIKEARERLAALAPADAYPESQLEAIIADASILASHPKEARAATRRALAALADLPRTADTLRLKQRLLIAAATAFAEGSDNPAAIEILDRLIVGMPDASLERSCLLEARAEARSDMNQPDLAAADAVESYRIAKEGGWNNARMQAAYVLAEIYGRAGLTNHALAMIDEVSALALLARRPQLLSMAAYSRGTILMEAGQFADALLAFALTEKTARQLGDSIGIATARAATCDVLVERGSLDDAERQCYGYDAEFIAARRTDLLARVRDAQARLALARGHPDTALKILDSVVSPSSLASIPTLLPTLYKDRATALNALGRHKEAFDYLDRSFALDRAASMEKRVRAVSVLAAAAQTEKLNADNRTLQNQLDVQRAELENQRHIRRLRDISIIEVTLLCVLLLLLLIVTYRHGKTLRRHRAVFLTYASNTPDAIVLLDVDARVRFANRNLFGDLGTTHPTGELLEDSLPCHAQGVVAAALQDIFERKRSVNCVAVLPVDGAATRYVELNGNPVITDGVLQGATLRSFDVTKVRQLERAVIDATSRTRQRLSSEIHEGLGQVLTGVMLLLRSAMTTVDRGVATTKQELTEVHDHVVGALSMAREIARGLSPIEIERGSLRDATQRLVSESARRFDIPMTFDFKGDQPVPELLAEHVYRIAAEGVMNAARHSGCTAVTIRLETTRESVLLTIEDDGTGIVDSSLKHEGLGLKLMTYHARILDGSLQFDPLVPHGTAVRLVVPRPVTGD